MSTVFFQSDHQNISIWNINTFKGKLKNFNGTNMMNYGICALLHKILTVVKAIIFLIGIFISINVFLTNLRALQAMNKKRIVR